LKKNLQDKVTFDLEYKKEQEVFTNSLHKRDEQQMKFDNINTIIKDLNEEKVEAVKKRDRALKILSAAKTKLNEFIKVEEYQKSIKQIGEMK